LAIVLIDTSIWLEVERDRFDLENFVEFGEIAICPPIAQELLQGARAPERYSIVWNNILDSIMLDDPMPLERFEDAAQIFACVARTATRSRQARLSRGRVRDLSPHSSPAARPRFRKDRGSCAAGVAAKRLAVTRS
jgi:predicted nucleic acid-binding protein